MSVDKKEGVNESGKVKKIKDVGRISGECGITEVREVWFCSESKS